MNKNEEEDKQGDEYRGARETKKTNRGQGNSEGRQSKNNMTKLR